jgi:alanyl-tRNA synthetase
MTLPTSDTRVTYPGGAVTASATVLHVETLPGGRRALILDATSAHPVDAGWPDQGPDRGVIRSSRAELPLLDCVVGATDGTSLHLGREIPVPKGSEGWAFVVAHIVAGEAGGDVAEGDTVEIEADAEYRRSLSAGHTACHLASLALNRAMAGRWKKEIRPDALGSPDFDAAAIDVSLIGEDRSTDTYRLGKSLRRKGFIVEGLAEALPELAAAVNSALAQWVETAAPVSIRSDGDRLTDRRAWVCELPGEAARIPCGGTHVESLADLGSLRASLSLSESEGTAVLAMETVASPVAPQT